MSAQLFQILHCLISDLTLSCIHCKICLAHSINDIDSNLLHWAWCKKIELANVKTWLNRTMAKDLTTIIAAEMNQYNWIEMVNRDNNVSFNPRKQLENYRSDWQLNYNNKHECTVCAVCFDILLTIRKTQEVKWDHLPRAATYTRLGLLNNLWRLVPN